ncbi:hypothetical protein [Sorangium cellulosum]|uniref:hypothetical protein n=1 Tax=Sorangium cellulosum TaxID=56 RepID=UPI0013EB0B07|nr:hypothetical protein [Sorangium cellulosum]
MSPGPDSPALARHPATPEDDPVRCALLRAPARRRGRVEQGVVYYSPRAGHLPAR